MNKRPNQTYMQRYSQSGTTALRFFMLLCLLQFSSFSLYGSNADTLRIMEWNVENLFDCRHDSLKNDQEFLPESMRHWTFHRYRHKLDAVAKVITAVGGWSAPALVALCEVENDSVLYSLTHYSALAGMQYQYVMTHSPDIRGIDVALLYQRDQFKLLSYRSIRIDTLHHYKPTRDILHVTGMLVTGDTLDVFVVHAPSRAGGALESAPFRQLCAETLKGEIDQTAALRTYPHILITGDFNDYPESPAIARTLKALPPDANIGDKELYHLLARQAKQTKFGTYKYQGEWNLLDHFIVSGSLLHPHHTLYTSERLTEIIRLPFLLTDDTTYGGIRPFRTYYGMKYEGGFSDHLPICMKLVVGKEKED